MLKRAVKWRAIILGCAIAGIIAYHLVETRANAQLFELQWTAPTDLSQKEIRTVEPLLISALIAWGNDNPSMPVRILRSSKAGEEMFFSLQWENRGNNSNFNQPFIGFLTIKNKMAITSSFKSLMPTLIDERTFKDRLNEQLSRTSLQTEFSDPMDETKAKAFFSMFEKLPLDQWTDFTSSTIAIPSLIGTTCSVRHGQKVFTVIFDPVGSFLTWSCDVP